jgi:hypothetical protein
MCEGYIKLGALDEALGSFQVGGGSCIKGNVIREWENVIRAWDSN